MRCTTNIQQLWRQNICSRWTSSVELSTVPAAQSRHHLQTVQATAKGTPFWEPWTQRSVTFDMYRLRKAFSYLLTYLQDPQYYLPPGSSDYPAFTPAGAGTRFSDPGGCKAELTWVTSQYSLHAKERSLRNNPAVSGLGNKPTTAFYTIRPWSH